MNKFYILPPTANDIYHFGTKRHSGRYPWGSGKRPYQSIDMGMSEEQKAEEKSRIIQSGSAAEVSSVKRQLTDQELRQVVTRLNLERQLDSMAKGEYESIMKKISNITDSLKTVTGLMAAGIGSYNTFVTLYNTTPEGKANPLKKIGSTK